MVEMRRADAGSSPPNVDVLVDGIWELLRLTQELRQRGAAVQLPSRLMQVCREVLNEAGSSPASGSSPRTPSSGDSQMSDADRALRDLPLRRLLLQVLNRGETVTVPEVVDRIARLGVPADSAKVSNALGYQVSRGHLIREHRGLYTYPVEVLSDDTVGTTVPSDASTPDTIGRSTRDDPRQQGDDHHRRTLAVRGQEDGRAKTTAQEQRKAV